LSYVENRPKSPRNDLLRTHQKPEKSELKKSQNPLNKAKKKNKKKSKKNRLNSQKIAQRKMQRSTKKKKKETTSITIQLRCNASTAVIHSINVY
jgi:hypothetical protein